MKLTVIILTHNSRDLILNCLNSVKSADEIIIVDDNSSDETLKLVESFRPTIIQHQLTGFSSQRNLALKQVKTDWVLFLDSDETVPLKLFSEIKTAISTDTYSAYRIKRLNYFFGKVVKHGGYWPDWQTRLFKVKDFQKFTGAIHETPHFSGTLGDLENHLTHFSHRNLAEGLEKSLLWTKKEAKEFIKANHPPVTWWRIVKVMVWEFCFRYFKKLGFLDGYVGFIESLIQAINRFFVYQQVWEIQQNENRSL
ncbi:MAG: glycosyltransferase family 2 protein [Patescibacteria group bacterium]|nr:glycosyltransferase family 2 protein [Patescibacteria group bacterium]